MSETTLPPYVQPVVPSDPQLFEDTYGFRQIQYPSRVLEGKHLKAWMRRTIRKCVRARYQAVRRILRLPKGKVSEKRRVEACVSAIMSVLWSDSGLWLLKECDQDLLRPGRRRELVETWTERLLPLTRKEEWSMLLVGEPGCSMYVAPTTHADEAGNEVAQVRGITELLSGRIHGVNHGPVERSLGHLVYCRNGGWLLLGTPDRDYRNYLETWDPGWFCSHHPVIDDTITTRDEHKAALLAFLENKP